MSNPPSTSFEHHKQRGNDLYRAKNYDEAICEYAKCIELNNGNYLPYANRAMCYLQLGKYKAAEIDCTKCLQLAPKYVKAYLRRGAARKALGKFDESLKDYRKVLRIQPKNTQALREMEGLTQILNAKRSFIKARKGKDKKRPTTKIKKIEQRIEYDTFREMFENAAKMEQSQREMSKNKIFFGQIVVGPPGSGKTTYCNTMTNYMTNGLHRKVAVINLDPDNENMEYHPTVDIRDLICSEDVAKHLKLGPNGSMLYCLEYLAGNMEWLRSRLDALEDDTYLIFDCPGQIELYIHHQFMRTITGTICNEWNYRVSCVNLVDCHHCAESANFISIALMTTSMMLHLELPHVNVLSKCDLVENYEESMAMPLEFYTEGHDLERLSDAIYGDRKEDDLLPIEKRFKKLNEEIAWLVNNYGLMSFVKLSVADVKMIADVCRTVDKSNGYDLCAEYYNQIQMEDKIMSARRAEREQEEELQGDQMDVDNDNENERDNEVIYGLRNPLYQNTAFRKREV